MIPSRIMIVSHYQAPYPAYLFQGQPGGHFLLEASRPFWGRLRLSVQAFAIPSFLLSVFGSPRETNHQGLVSHLLDPLAFELERKSLLKDLSPAPPTIWTHPNDINGHTTSCREVDHF